MLEGVLTERDGKASFQPEWTWRPEDSDGLPLALRSNFAGTDECKPVDGGKAVLITSSANALALVSYETHETLFYAKVRNAHSAALLPGRADRRRIVFFPDGTGDRLLLFDRTAPDHAIGYASAELGAWRRMGPDERSALGARRSESYEIKIDGARMIVEKTFPLPSRGGHDLVLSATLPFSI